MNLSKENLPYFIQGRIASHKRSLDDSRVERMERARIQDAIGDLQVILETLEAKE